MKLFNVFALVLLFSFGTHIQLIGQEDEAEHGRPAKPLVPVKAVPVQEATLTTSIFFVKGIPGLTTRQKDKIDKLRHKMDEEIGVLNKQKAEKAGQLNALKKDDNSDQTVVDKLSIEVKNLEIKIDDLRKKYLLDVRKLLKDNQITYFDEHRLLAHKSDSIAALTPPPPPAPQKKKSKNKGGGSSACPGSE